MLIALVFICSFIGFYQTLGDKFNLFGVLFAIFNFFALNDADPSEVSSNGFILLAKYFAAFLLGVSLFTLSYKYIRKAWFSMIIRLEYNNHIVVFSLDALGYRISKELAESGYKVVVVEENEESPHIEELEALGVIIINGNPFREKTFDQVGLNKASICILVYDKDEINVEIAGCITSFGYRRFDSGDDIGHRVLKLFIHIADSDNRSVIKDYFDINNSDEHYDLHVFNLNQLAAQKVYDDFSPHKYMLRCNEEEEQAIAVIGLDKTAEAFILENIILSQFHYKNQLTIYLVDKDVDVFFHHFTYNYPYHADFVNLIPVKLLNANFFANFTWSKAHIEKLSQVKAAYFFGDKDAVIMNRVAAFRQFLYTQTLAITQVPLVVSLPEDSGIYNFLNDFTLHRDEVEHLLNQKLNQHYIRQKSDTFSGNNLIEEAEIIDTIARVINFYYAVLYEFQDKLKERFQVSITGEQIQSVSSYILAFPEYHASFTEAEFESKFFVYLSKVTGKAAGDLYQELSIIRTWNLLNNRKKDSNRYAARHMQVKLFIMQEIGCTPLSRENIIRFYPRLASIEHNRWSAEKMVFNYRYGSFSNDRNERYILKEVLKIHDQLVTFNGLPEKEKEKDLNLFLLLPLLNVLRDQQMSTSDAVS